MTRLSLTGFAATAIDGQSRRQGEFCKRHIGLVSYFVIWVESRGVAEVFLRFGLSSKGTGFAVCVLLIMKDSVPLLEMQNSIIVFLKPFSL